MMDHPGLERARLKLEGALNAPEARPNGSSTVRRLLAATHLRLGSPLDAEELLLDKGVLDESQPAATRREAKFLLGVCYQKSGRAEQAMTMFEEVLGEDQGHWRARFHVALLAVSEGEYSTAEELLEEVLESNAEHEEARKILDKLQERADAENNRLVIPEQTTSK